MQAPPIAVCPVTGRMAILHFSDLVQLVDWEQGEVNTIANIHLPARPQDPIQHLAMYSSLLAVGSARECKLFRMKLWRVDDTPKDAQG